MLPTLLVAVCGLLLALALFRLVERRLTYVPRPLAEGRLEELVAGLPPGPDRYEEVAFGTPDGERLTGWIGRPPAGDWLLWCHGNAGSLEHRFPDLVRFVRESGLSVLVFDYRGYGRSSGRPSEAGLYADAESALDYLGSLGVRSERVTVLGRSLGGAVAVELARRRPLRGLILESAFTSIRDMAGVVVPLLPLGRLVRARFANDEKVGALSLPILHFHGLSDRIVPFAQGTALRNRIRSPGYRFVAVDSDHLDLSERLGPDYFELVRDFTTRTEPR